MLALDASLDLAAIPGDVASELRCQLRVRATEEAAPATRPLVTNLGLVLDCSGSMEGEKCEAAIAAAKRIVDTVDARHRISIISFASSSRVIVDNMQAGERAAIKEKIDKLQAEKRGSTNLGSAIRTGADTVSRYGSDAKVLVVLSDGVADDPKDAIAHAVRASELGVQLFAVGIGEEYEADHLRKLATPSSGEVFAPDRLDQLAATFAKLVTRIESFVATNARLTITLGVGVRGRHLYKTRPQQAFVADWSTTTNRDFDVRVGNIERGQTAAYLLSMIAPPRSGASLEVMRATLTYDVPAHGLRGQTQNVALTVTYGGEAREADVDISGVYRRAQIARLVDELADAQRRGAQDECLAHAELLIRLSDEQGDDRMRATYEQLRDGIAAGRAVAQRALNEVVLASTALPTEAAEKSGVIKQLYDVVLVSAGDSPILLMRALREATGKPLRELNEAIATPPAAIREAVPKRDAEALIAQIEAAGTGAVLRVRRR